MTHEPAFVWTLTELLMLGGAFLSFGVAMAFVGYEIGKAHRGEEEETRRIVNRHSNGNGRTLAG